MTVGKAQQLYRHASGRYAGQINWDYIVQLSNQYIHDFRQAGITRPGLRGLFYRLHSLSGGQFPNTQNAYKSLSNRLARAREAGEIEPLALKDSGRVTRGITKPYVSIDDYVERYVTELQHLERYYTFPRWHEQPHYVEIWVEKEALVDVFQSTLEQREVTISPMKGNASSTAIVESLDRVLAAQKNEKQVHILYFGDYDPSGIDMSRNYVQKSLPTWAEHSRYRDLDITTPDFFQRIALVEDQISNLPQVPEDDVETMVKVMRDNNTPKFLVHNGAPDSVVQQAKSIIKNNQLNIKKDAPPSKQAAAVHEFLARIGSYLPIIELDAFYAVQPEAFVNLVRGIVDQYFDVDIHDSVKSEHDPRVIKGKVRERVRFLDEDD